MNTETKLLALYALAFTLNLVFLTVAAFKWIF